MVHRQRLQEPFLGPARTLRGVECPRLTEVLRIDSRVPICHVDIGRGHLGECRLTALNQAQSGFVSTSAYSPSNPLKVAFIAVRIIHHFIQSMLIPGRGHVEEEPLDELAILAHIADYPRHGCLHLCRGVSSIGLQVRLRVLGIAAGVRREMPLDPGVRGHGSCFDGSRPARPAPAG
jgi:hypothetical protein